MGADGAIPRGSIRLNGEVRSWSGGSLAALLREIGEDPARPGIAVAINGAIVGRSLWERRDVETGDVVELVGAVQGG